MAKIILFFSLCSVAAALFCVDSKPKCEIKIANTG